jgi:transposase-like protein
MRLIQWWICSGVPPIRIGSLPKKVAVEAIRGQRTLNELAGEYEIHPVQIAQWKKRVLETAAEGFFRRGERLAKDEEALKAGLFEEIGRLKMEVGWLKKKLGLAP